jgi:hypothetical protein
MKKSPKTNLKNEDEKISKIKIEEALEDFNKILKLTEDLDLKNIEKTNFKYLKSKAQKYEKDFKQKYNINLDPKK